MWPKRIPWNFVRPLGQNRCEALRRQLTPRDIISVYKPSHAIPGCEGGAVFSFSWISSGGALEIPPVFSPPENLRLVSQIEGSMTSRWSGQPAQCRCTHYRALSDECFGGMGRRPPRIHPKLRVPAREYRCLGGISCAIKLLKVKVSRRLTRKRPLVRIQSKTGHPPI